MTQKTCPVCELPVNPGITLCPQCGWDFPRVLGTPEVSGKLLQQKLEDAKAEWVKRGIQPVGELTSRFQGYDLILTWKWPKDAELVWICHRHDTFPTKQKDPKASVAVCTRREYERNLCWTLRNPQDKPHYFAVYAAKSATGPFSPAAQIMECMGQLAEINYRIVKRKRFILFGPVASLHISLKTKADICLQALILVGKRHSLPVSPGDGVILKEIQNVQFVRGKAVVPVPPEHWSRELVVRLFFAKPADAKNIRLLHGNTDKMRLG
jgi:hypothetical protein